MAEKDIDSLDIQLDTIVRFPEWVNQRIRDQCADPVMAAFNTLPSHRKANVQRQLEMAIMKEDMSMTPEERTSWITRAELIIPHDYVYVLFSFGHTYRQNKCRNVEEAAQLLFVWIPKWQKKHANLKSKQLDIDNLDLNILRKLVFEQTTIELQSFTYSIEIQIEHKWCTDT